MNIRRLIFLLGLVVSTLVLAGISGAKEARQDNSAIVSTKVYEHITKMKEISESKIEIDENAPMKIAVDNYLVKIKAEGVVQSETEQPSLEGAEGSQQVTTTLVVVPKKKDNVSTANITLAADSRQDIQSKQIQADQILTALIAKNTILQGSTVVVRDCPHDWQGCTYYKTGEIWIDPDHTAPLEKIMIHEVNHLIDWRSDGDIDNNDYHE